MSTELATKEPPSVIADMAARYGMDRRAFEATIRETCIPSNEKAKVTNEQFAAFLLVAKEYNLNPLTKEIYAYPARSGGIQPIVGVDGWCRIVNNHPQLNGIEFDDIKNDKGEIIAIACKIHRKDREHPTVAIEYMSECKRGTEPWKQWPVRMLRHKALIQAARYAFGFSGIVDPDEAERIEMVDVTPPVKSLFKNATLRNDWCKKVLEAIKESDNEKDMNAVIEAYKPKIEEMRANGHESDLLAIDTIETTYNIQKNKIQEFADNETMRQQIADSYGDGFAGISGEPEQEVQVVPTFIRTKPGATA